MLPVVLKLPAARLRRTGNLRMQDNMHRIRSLTPLQAAGNALAMHVHRVNKQPAHDPSLHNFTSFKFRPV